MDSVLASYPVAPGLILDAPKKYIARHCLVSEQCKSNEPSLHKAVVHKSRWGVWRASATKNIFLEPKDNEETHLEQSLSTA